MKSMFRTVLFNEVFPDSLFTDEECDYFPYTVLICAVFSQHFPPWYSTVSSTFSISKAVLT